MSEQTGKGTVVTEKSGPQLKAQEKVDTEDLYYRAEKMAQEFQTDIVSPDERETAKLIAQLFGAIGEAEGSVANLMASLVDVLPGWESLRESHQHTPRDSSSYSSELSHSLGDMADRIFAITEVLSNVRRRMSL